jgi:hypothetical protein
MLGFTLNVQQMSMVNKATMESFALKRGDLMGSDLSDPLARQTTEDGVDCVVCEKCLHVAPQSLCLHCSSGHLLCHTCLDAEIDRVATQYGVEERGCIVTCQVGEWLG